MADPNAKCPTCGSDKFTYRPGGERWWCGQCRVSFEVGKNPTPAPVTIEGTVDSGVGGLASTRPALPSTAGGGTRPATRTLSPADIPARDRLDALVETVREGIDSDSGDYTTQDIGHAALSELAGIARQGAENKRKVEAYDAARAQVKREGHSRAEYVLRTEAAEAEQSAADAMWRAENDRARKAEAECDRLNRVADNLLIVAEVREEERDAAIVERDRLKAALRKIADRISTPRELAVELRALADVSAPSGQPEPSRHRHRDVWVPTTSRLERNPAPPTARLADVGGTHRHGRECPCTPCRREDWDAVDARIRRADVGGTEGFPPGFVWSDEEQRPVFVGGTEETSA